MRVICRVAMLMLLAVGGCAPTRYAWSPDGTHMTVIAGDGLHLATAAGDVQPQAIAGVGVATWFADSRRLLVGREVQVGSWNDLAPALTKPQVYSIEQAAKHARDAIFEYDWDSPDALADGRFLAFVKQRAHDAHRDTAEFDRWAVPIAIYLEDHRDDALRQAAPAKWWQQLQALRQSVKRVEVYHVAESQPVLDATLASTLADLADVRPSPDGRNVLFTTSAGEQACDLWVAPADGKRPAMMVSNGSAGYADWSSDSRRIAYIAAIASADGNQIVGGKLRRIEVADASGALKPKLPAAEDLCDVHYMGLSKVRSLTDGRIVFCAGPESGATAAWLKPPPAELFSVDPAHRGPAQPLLPAAMLQQLGDSVESFELNPSGTRLSTADSQGHVFAVDLHSHELRVVQDQSMQSDRNNPGIVSNPSWHSDDLLTLVVPGSAGQLAVADWSWPTGKITPLSAKWPASLLPKTQ